MLVPQDRVTSDDSKMKNSHGLYKIKDESIKALQRIRMEYKVGFG